MPRGPDDAIYERAASARRAFWQSRGTVRGGFAAERATANVYAQTKWFGPHRRILVIDAPGRMFLATDGLSTPWAGISDPENGVECELFMEFGAATLDATTIADWGNLLINLGDLVADGYRVARDVEKHGAILFCRLTADYLPLTRIVLGRDPGRHAFRLRAADPGNGNRRNRDRGRRCRRGLGRIGGAPGAGETRHRAVAHGA
ncbi:UNVERIFIED_ORG: hypothetical protein GGD59_004307 [Rhizobium esperanzae]